MRLITPRRSWPLWLSGILLGVAVIPLLMYQGHLYYSEGGTSPDGPGMLFVSVVMLMPAWFGIWLALMAVYLWRYRGGEPVLAFGAPTWLGGALSIVAVMASCLFVLLALVRLPFWLPSRLPFTAHLLGCAIHWQYLRASAAARSRGG